MGATEWDDPHGILPESFRERYRDCETVEQALRKAENTGGTTPLREKRRCKTCRSVRIRKKTFKHDIEHRREGEYKCTSCSAHFSQPRAPLAECPVEEAWKWLDRQQRYRTMHNDTMPMNTPFEWVAPSELKEPSDRTTALSQLDDETLTALAIRAYEPWSDDGRSYSEIADVLPYSRWWVGERVRAWKDGEYRDLVADPIADDRPTTASDPFEYGRVAATDGGTERSRWAAYGRG